MKKSYASVATYQPKNQSYSPAYVNAEGEFVPYENKSKTQPNMALSVKEILNKYAQGGRINAVPGVYTGEDLLPDIRRMDMVDIDDLKAQNDHKIKVLEREYNELMEKDNARKNEAIKRQQEVFDYYENQLKKLKGNESAGAPTSDDRTRSAA